MIGPASYSELKKTIAICAQNHNIELQFSVKGCFTDGEVIYLSPPPNDLNLPKRWTILESGAIHESWHILFKSNFELLRNFIKKFEEKYKSKIPFIGQIVKDIVNIIEDSRVEELGKKRFQGNKLAIDFSNSYWLSRRPPFKNLPNWRIFYEALLEIALTNGIKEKIPDKAIEKLTYVASFYIYWAKKQENSVATFEAAEKILSLMLEIFDFEGDYSSETQLPPPTKTGSAEKDEKKYEEPYTLPPLPPDRQKMLDEVKKELEKDKKSKEKDDLTKQKESEEKKSESSDQEGSKDPSGRKSEPTENGNSTEPGESKSETADSGSSMEPGSEKGESAGSESSMEPGSEKGESAGSESSMEPGSEKGESAGSESSMEPGSEKGESAGSENSIERGNGIERPIDSNDSSQSRGGEEKVSDLTTLERESPPEGDSIPEDASKEKLKEEIEQPTSKSEEGRIEKPQEGRRELEGKSEKGSDHSPEKNGASDRETTTGSETEIPIVRYEDIDPFVNELLDERSLRLKIDDLTKQNIRLSKTNHLEKQLEIYVRNLNKQKIFEYVFKTETQDVGIQMRIPQTSRSESNFLRIKKSINRLIQVTINQFKSLFQVGTKQTSQLKSGRLDSKQMVRGIVTQDSHVFKKKSMSDSRNEVVITLLIDQSGSMGGPKISNAQKAAILFSEVLDSLNIAFSVYGWTDIDFSYLSSRGYLRHRETRIPKLTIPVPHGINPEIFTIFAYKEFEDDYQDIRMRLAEITSLMDNSDHNAINYSMEKLLKTKKKVKILLVLSDGQPAAYRYEIEAKKLRMEHRKHYDVGNVGLNLTRQAIEKARARHVQVLCISIDEHQNYQEQIYGKNNYLIVSPNKISELPSRLANLLRLILRQAGVKL